MVYFGLNAVSFFSIFISLVFSSLRFISIVFSFFIVNRGRLGFFMSMIIFSIMFMFCSMFFMFFFDFFVFFFLFFGGVFGGYWGIFVECVVFILLCRVVLFFFCSYSYIVNLFLYYYLY